MTRRWIALAAAVIAAGAHGCRNPTPDQQRVEETFAGEDPANAPGRGGTRVVLLGTGTPNPDPDRSGPALAVVTGGRAYLVDCGPGVVRRAAAGRRADIEELAPVLLDRVFITHLHSDHTAGYADLILTPWAVGRRQPLLVHGPRGTQRMTDHIVAAYREDLEVRSRGEADGYGVVVHEVEPGVVYEDESVRVTAFPVRHGTWEHAYGYAFEAPDRTVVVSGDTAPADSVVEACDGCDVLVHEVYSEAGLLRGPADWRSYHRAFHTSSVELGKLASRAEPELLVLTHQLYWGTTDEELVAEVRAHFDGPVVSGADLDVY